jgi:hypothetical protein
MKTLITTIAILISLNSFAEIKKIKKSKKIVSVQKGVRSSKGLSGVYIYYKNPDCGNFNVEKDRTFLTKKEYFNLNR